jgi:hypothetical protein
MCDDPKGPRHCRRATGYCFGDPHKAGLVSWQWHRQELVSKQRAALFSSMTDPKTDRYSIEIKNLTTGEIVILTTVDMTDDEKSGVVRQLLRLSGAPAALWIEDDEPKKPF